MGHVGAAAVVPVYYFRLSACAIWVPELVSGFEQSPSGDVYYLPGRTRVRVNTSGSSRTIFYACIKPSFDKAQVAVNVLMGIGQAGPLTLLPSAI